MLDVVDVLLDVLLLDELDDLDEVELLVDILEVLEVLEVLVLKPVSILPNQTKGIAYEDELWLEVDLCAISFSMHSAKSTRIRY